MSILKKILNKKLLDKFYKKINIKFKKYLNLELYFQPFNFRWK